MAPMSMPPEVETIEEDKLIPEGQRTLRIISAEEGRTKDNDADQVTFKFVDDSLPECGAATFWLTWPNATSDEQQAKWRYQDIARFAVLTDLPRTGDVDYTKVVGKSFLVNVVYKKGYANIQLPRLKT